MRFPRSKLTQAQTERLLEHFVAGTAARPAGELVGVNRNTARLFYHRLRVLIARHLARERPPRVDVAFEIRCFSGVSDLQPVFGLLGRRGKVHAVLLRAGEPGATAPTRPPRLRLEAIVATRAPQTRRVLHAADLRHFRLGSDASRSPIDSVENFWSQAKRHLRKYNGMSRENFSLFLGECEWRFNYGPPRRARACLQEWMSRR